ncbi:hypothetical protein [Clostridium tyrobutyricum]|nr:hypothetical protein [Clostridium tyrobutyricum]MBV4417056.1 hypothetical protein [Clostridium tyrobutyricum]MBV4441525.1 hypothetical protein [Clostridium tyrobutyricum]
MDNNAKKARNEYMRKWRSKNRDKVKATQERYWNKKSKKLETANNK